MRRLIRGPLKHFFSRNDLSFAVVAVGVGPVSGSGLVLEDATVSFLLLEDGSFLLLEG